jgi:hypothetical protein
MNKQSLGGQVTAKKSRQVALNNYYSNPNICKFCNKILEVKDHQKVSYVRTKEFCNTRCSALLREQLTKKPKYVRIDKTMATRTKGELFENRSNYQSARTAIQRHARFVFKEQEPNPSCQVCNYSTHVEVAHRQSVSSFPSETLISEINSISNLIGLCPNHHWEFDNGVLKLN